MEEVSRASDTRLAARSAYLKASAAKAKADTDAAKRVLAAQAAIAGGWSTESKESEEQRIAAEAQLADFLVVAVEIAKDGLELDHPFAV